MRGWGYEDRRTVDKEGGVAVNSLQERLKNLSAQQRRLLLEQLRGQGALPKLGNGNGTPPVTPTPRTHPVPLSFAQQRLWFLHQLGNSSAYNVPLQLKLDGDLDIAALQQSLQTIVQRHESLRTTFAVGDATAGGTPYQVIHPHMTIDLPVVTLQAYAPAAQSAAIERLTADEARRPFDLGQDPMLRATLLQLDNRQYILLLTLHHIAADGWSMGVLVRELTQLYTAYRQGQPSPLPNLPIQYADFAAWQRSYLQGTVLTRQLEYWRQRLAGAPALIHLPTDRPRPAQQSLHGAGVPVQLDARLTQQLRALGQAHGATLYMTLLAAFQVLLGRYSGQTDIVVGTPIANRSRRELEPLIGFFVNTLALRTDLAGAGGAPPAFLDVLAQVQTHTQAAYEHQDLPFERLVEELQLARTLHYNPLVQVVLTLQNTPPSVFDLPGLQVAPVEMTIQTTRFDLELHFWEGEAGLQGTCVYSTDLFAQATIQRMMGHFQTLLAGIVANPQQSIAELPLLTAPERDQLLVAWNATATDYPKDKCIHQLFEEQVERTPDAVAVVLAGRMPGWQGDKVILNDDVTLSSCHPVILAQLTYRELNTRANQLASRLQSLGVGQGTLVGICVERSLEMIVGLLAILKAGCAYLPLDPTYPQERLAFIVQDGGVTILLTQKRLRNAMPVVATTLYLDDDLNSSIASRMGAGEKAKSRIGGYADDLAYLMYTSGSTGQPKGVLVTHRNVVRLVKATNFMHFGADEVCLQLASIAFDAATLEIWGPLLNGGRLVIMPPHQPTLAELGAAIQANHVTTLWLTAGLFQLMVDEQLPSLRPLRQLIAGGDVLSAAHVQRISQAWPHIRLINGYGPTENTTFTCCYPIPTEWAGGRAVPIGKPIANTQVYILDQSLQPAPIGVWGELYAGGDGLARGYHKRPELTTERFIANPFAIAQQPGRLYKSGDRVRWLADGNIEFEGRLDNQVKIRGFRIELGEIEAVLSQHPMVQEAVVVAHRSEPGQQQLIAYIVASAHTEGRRLTHDYHDYLQRKLPDYMLPAAFVYLDTLPLTPNGKVDRKALPTPAFAPLADATTFAPARTPTEIALADIWCAVLGVDLIDIHDNFFQLGGHSLLATQVVSRIHHTLKLDVSLRLLFENATIARLGAEIDRLTEATDRHKIQAIPLADRTRPLPLSHAQERLWFLDQLGDARHAYNIPIALRLHGRLDIAALQRALYEIVCRHESLRTTFVVLDGQPVQMIHPGAFTLPVIDLSTWTASAASAEIQRLIRAEVEHCFDLRHGPLLRATLVGYRASPVALEHVLLLNLHHSAADGWSIEIFNRELAALYRAFSQGQPSPLAPLTIQYADFAVWQRRWLVEAATAAQLDYWQTRLQGAPPLLMLPTDRPRPSVQRYSGAAYSFTLPAALSRRLRAFSAAANATLFMTLLAAFKVLLMRYSRQTDLVVGSPIANRNHVALEPLIGFFVNTLALRSDLSGDQPFSELLSQIKSTTLDAYRHQDVPFEKVIDQLRPERNLSYSPLFQVMFDVIKSAFFTIDLPGLRVENIAVAHPVAKFDLKLAILEATIPAEPERLAGLIEYNTDLFDSATLERMAGHFQTLLQAIVDDPHQSIHALPLLTEGERHQLLTKGASVGSTSSPTDAAAEFVEAKCIHQLFEAQVARTPDAVAVIFDVNESYEIQDTTYESQFVDATIVNRKSKIKNNLTYRELNTRANQLAHHLQTLGITGDGEQQVRVGICIERSIEMLIGVLGILKAGGVFVPLDPSDPPERRAYMLDAAQVTLILVHEATAEHFTQEHKLVNLDSDWPRIAQSSTSNPLHPLLTPLSPAYIVYTSGSTGRPKGVVGHHRGVVNFLHYLIHTYGLNQTDVVLQLARLTFDASIRDLIGPLTVGAKVVLIQQEAFNNPQELLITINRQRVTCLLSVVPTMVKLLVEVGATLNAEHTALTYAAVRLILISGEPLQLSLCWRARAFFGEQTVLVNQYGPTECTMTSTYSIVPQQRAPDQPDGIAHLGQPIQNCQIYLLDEHLQPVPIGIPGEVYIGGAGITHGYLPQTAPMPNPFMPNPFAAAGQPGTFYKTGDLARYRPDTDGRSLNLEFLGRIDHQVKLRGIRIELGEIEAILSSAPFVQAAAVLLWEKTPGNPVLVAYVTQDKVTRGEDDKLMAIRSHPAILSSPHPLTPSALRDYLRQKLPDYMMPATFVVLEAMPLTPNRKIDRRALPAPDMVGVEPALVAPRTPTEATLAAIWQVVLEIEQVGIHNNFFASGGHSLLATQVIARIRQHLQVELPLRHIFAAPTIAELADQIEKMKISQALQASVADDSAQREEIAL